MHPLTSPGGILSDSIEQTCRLYADMDRDYQTAAAACGFVCNGCEDNCCRSLFHHHTYLEFITLYSGFERLPPELRQRSKERAAVYMRSAAAGARGPFGQRTICPLNEGGRCILYAQRPMICRLHGIPHVFTPPGQPRREGPGCEAFYRQCGRQVPHRLDRTPHYLKLARLESRFKQALGLNRKIKLTVAEMLLKEPLACIDGGRRPSSAARAYGPLP